VGGVLCFGVFWDILNRLKIAPRGLSNPAHLTTHDFQARPFYEKHGYTVFGQLKDLPRGRVKYYMQKTLAPGVKKVRREK
jgi:hypothetical protein